MVFNSLFSIFAFDYFFLLYFPYTIIPRLNFSNTFNYKSFLFLSNFLHRLFPFHFRSAFLRFFKAPISLSFFRFHVYFLRFISFILSSPLTYFFAFLLRPLVQSSSNSSIFFDFFLSRFFGFYPSFFSLFLRLFSLFPFLSRFLSFPTASHFFPKTILYSSLISFLHFAPPRCYPFFIHSPSAWRVSLIPGRYWVYFGSGGGDAEPKGSFSFSEARSF